MERNVKMGPKLVGAGIKKPDGYNTARTKQERNETMHFLSVDFQNIKNTDYGRHKGSNAGKKGLGKERLHATIQVVKRNEQHVFAVLLQRWVVGRALGWLENAAA